MKTTIRTLEGIEHQIEVYHNDWEWCAVEENYDGPEDHYRARGGKTQEEAIEALRESLEEHDNRWKVPNEYDWFNLRTFVFLHHDSRIEIGPMEGLSYSRALRMVPLGAELLIIHKQ
jgi:hypothetical protein